MNRAFRGTEYKKAGPDARARQRAHVFLPIAPSFAATGDSHAPACYTLEMKFTNHTSLLIRCIDALCLAGASYNHARIVFDHGLSWDYGGMPLLVSAFWTALTFFDPLAIVLLLARPKAGLILTAAIITSDVAVNAWVAFHYGADWLALSAQVVFLLFVLATSRAAWTGLPRAERRLFK